jgi:hypothetical protein
MAVEYLFNSVEQSDFHSFQPIGGVNGPSLKFESWFELLINDQRDAAGLIARNRVL